MMSGDHYISLKGRVSKTFLTICLVYIITLLTDKVEFSHHQYLSNTVCETCILTICLVYIITLLTDKVEFSHHQYLSNTVCETCILKYLS